MPGGRIVAWRAKLQRSIWPLAVVVGGVPGEDKPQVVFAEDQNAVGEFGSGGADESVRRSSSMGDLRKVMSMIQRVTRWYWLALHTAVAQRSPWLLRWQPAEAAPQFQFDYSDDSAGNDRNDGAPGSGRAHEE
jgi:hypothetical protein